MTPAERFCHGRTVTGEFYFDGHRRRYQNLRTQCM
jgi:hypothetical protein